MLKKLANEPSLVTGVVLAVIGVASAFGLGITDAQSDAIVAVVGAVLALIGSVVVRQQVTPARLVAAKYGASMGGAGAVTTSQPEPPEPVHAVDVDALADPATDDPAADTAGEDGWDPAEHPRDARGRFVDDDQ